MNIKKLYNDFNIFQKEAVSNETYRYYQFSLQLVNEQLANTDAYFIKVYSLGQTTVFYADAATHRDIVILKQKKTY